MADRVFWGLRYALGGLQRRVELHVRANRWEGLLLPHLPFHVAGPGTCSARLKQPNTHSRRLAVCKIRSLASCRKRVSCRWCASFAVKFSRSQSTFQVSNVQRNITSCTMVSKGITLKIWHGGRHELGTRIGEQVLQGRAGAGDQGPLLQAEPRPRSESLAFPRIYQDTQLTTYSASRHVSN